MQGGTLLGHNQKSAKYRREPLRGTMLCATLSACLPLPHRSASTNCGSSGAASARSSGVVCLLGGTPGGMPRGKVAGGREASETIAKQLWKEFFVRVRLLPDGTQPDTVEEDVLMRLLTCELLP